jgi:hypothetical protein
MKLSFVEQNEQNSSYYWVVPVMCAVCRDIARREGRSKLPGVRVPATHL